MPDRHLVVKLEGARAIFSRQTVLWSFTHQVLRFKQFHFVHSNFGIGRNYIDDNLAPLGNFRQSAQTVAKLI